MKSQRGAKRVPPGVLVLTDASRGFDVRRQLQTWPEGAALIERCFGQAPTPRPKQLRRGKDTRLRLATASAMAVRRAHLDGIHWPQKLLCKRLRSGCAGLIETASAHNGLAIARAQSQNMAAILVSTAFQSDSPSAGRPLGPIRLARLQRAFPHARLYALGGIDAKTAKRLRHTGVCGVALVSGGRNAHIARH
jgi:thiamine-phosphate pyrophosphorylase